MKLTRTSGDLKWSSSRRRDATHNLTEQKVAPWPDETESWTVFAAYEQIHGQRLTKPAVGKGQPCKGRSIEEDACRRACLLGRGVAEPARAPARAPANIPWRNTLGQKGGGQKHDENSTSEKGIRTEGSPGGIGRAQRGRRRARAA
jgi:hypothetical protein